TKRALIGAPISNELAMHERLTKVKALAIFSSDPLSSVAYATEEILRVLILAAATGALSIMMPIGFAIMLLLAIVATSYRQTIAAYPRGGGSYIVAKDNLGTLPGLAAGASILIDYTMTVAVSVSAGIAAVYSLFPMFREFRVELCLGVIVLVTIANLRGVREAGNIFSVPTYIFVLGIMGLIAVGVARLFLGIGDIPVYERPEETLQTGAEALTLFLILRAFTQGCTALTGVEAISDGVPAFKPPEAPNARATLAWMAVLAISMFGGITLLADRLGIVPSERETVLSQIGRTIFPEFGGANPLWFVLQIATALILVLAANTAFADFPRLSYFLARDRFLPHQYAFKGDRLAFSWGIITLAIVACVLIIVFNGDTTTLIPLYTVGVFNSFTLSQAGMVVRWWRTKTPGWQRNLIINGLGALATFLVLIVSAVTKFTSGAWIVLVLIPVMIVMFLAINRHYKRIASEVAETVPMSRASYRHTFIVPVSSLNQVALNALAYARSLSANVVAVHIVEGEDLEETERFHAEWQRLIDDKEISLAIIESPYRSLIGPLLSYIDALDQQSPDDTLTIVLPELLPAKPWEYLLHNQNAFRLRAALLFRPNTVVSDMPYLLGRGRTASAGSGGLALLGRFPWVPLLVLLSVLFLIYQFVF
ncbi:MAG: APC family permease, partial [Chloroflexia bacterium]